MGVVLLVALLLLPGAAAAECDSRCERQTASDLIKRGETRSAIESLKSARARFPADRDLALLLARAYLLEDNLFWAEGTLREAVEAWPADAELRAWLAAVHLRQGDPELAGAALAGGATPPSDPDRSRWLLLTAAQARLADEPAGAAEALAAVDRRSTLFPEDRPLWASLAASADPWWQRALSGSLELGLGATSNALAGSPTDPGRAGESSGLALLELRARLVPPSDSPWRPAFELELLGDGIEEPQYRELSSLQGALRAGAETTAGGRRLGLFYRGELLWLDQDEALYSEAHRAELELEWPSGGVLFAGAGHRAYREDERSRWEADLGGGGSLGRLGGTPLLGGVTLRLAAAESPAYDQLGVSAALSARFALGARSALRAALSAAWDDYLNSGGLPGQCAFGTTEKRRDLLGRVELQLWLPPWKNLRPGLELRGTARSSTADTTPGFDFSYEEWRAVAWLEWRFAADPWGPRTAHAADHVPLEWGLDRERGLDEDRILDLLRRDEELRRGSSCGLR